MRIPLVSCWLLLMWLGADVATAASPRDELADLAARKDLHLVSRPGSRAQSFGFTWRCSPDAAGTRKVEVVVEAGPGGAAWLIRERGFAFCYVTDGLFVCLDSQRPGRIIARQDMELRFVFGVRPDGKGLALEYHFWRLKQGSFVEFDLSSVLRSLAQRAEIVEADPVASVISIQAGRQRIDVQRATERDAPLAIRRIALHNDETEAHTFDDIWIGTPPAGSILGLTLQHLHDLKAEVALADDGGDFAHRMFMPPRDFWTVPANRAAGEELAALVASLSRARRDPTTRAADPPAQANAAPPAQQVQEPARPRRFDPQRAEVKLMFDGLWRILAGLNLSPQQTAEVKAALAVGQARFDEIIGQLEQRDADAETVHRAIVAAGERLIENLREPLTDAQDSRFGAAWLVFINEDADRASVYNLLGVIAAGVLELDLPDKQRREAVEPLWDAWRRMERLRGQVQAGELRQAEAVRRVLEVTNALMGQLERVLGPDLYRKLDEYVRRHADPRLLRPRSD